MNTKIIEKILTRNYLRISTYIVFMNTIIYNEILERNIMR